MGRHGTTPEKQKWAASAILQPRPFPVKSSGLTNAFSFYHAVFESCAMQMAAIALFLAEFWMVLASNSPNQSDDFVCTARMFGSVHSN
jgi:hypothetical protein